MVCSHKTGHAEAVQVIYDADEVSYESLVRSLSDFHNPTTPNRQGLDIGNQYRSAIFYHDKEQDEIATKVKEELEQSGGFRRKIVTQIVPATAFYRAEEYHQRYYKKHNR